MSRVYEIKDPFFEFYKKGKPSGNFARGIVIDGDDTRLRLELLCNGLKVWVRKDKLIFITEDNHTLGRNYKGPTFIDNIRELLESEDEEC